MQYSKSFTEVDANPKRSSSASSNWFTSRRPSSDSLYQCSSPLTRMETKTTWPWGNSTTGLSLQVYVVSHFATEKNFPCCCQLWKCCRRGLVAWPVYLTCNRYVTADWHAAGVACSTGPGGQLDYATASPFSSQGKRSPVMEKLWANDERSVNSMSLLARVTIFYCWP